jgi:hypothetical protein
VTYTSTRAATSTTASRAFLDINSRYYPVVHKCRPSDGQRPGRFLQLDGGHPAVPAPAVDAEFPERQNGPGRSPRDLSRDRRDLRGGSGGLVEELILRNRYRNPPVWDALLHDLVAAEPRADLFEARVYRPEADIGGERPVGGR